MNIPNWVLKRIPANEKIECVAIGSITSEKYESVRMAALVGTNIGLKFFTKGIVSQGISYSGIWEELSGKTQFYAKIGIIYGRIIMRVDRDEIILRTSKSEANSFISYIDSKRAEIKRLSRFAHLSSSTDIVSSIKVLKKLLDDGIITEYEFEKKKTELLNRL